MRDAPTTWMAWTGFAGGCAREGRDVPSDSTCEGDRGTAERKVLGLPVRDDSAREEALKNIQHGRHTEELAMKRRHSIAARFGLLVGLADWVLSRPRVPSSQPSDFIRDPVSVPTASARAGTPEGGASEKLLAARSRWSSIPQPGPVPENSGPTRHLESFGVYRD